MQYEFHSWEKEALEKVIRERRDIRSFRSEPIPESLVWKILQSGHLAASVGFSQPWNFLVLQDKNTHRQVYEHFVSENTKASQLFPDAKGETYRSLKLQGLLDSPLHIVVTCDSFKNGEHVLGRTSVKEVDEYSVCLAVQNIWLTARAEGIGVGWMSIYDPVELPKILGIPDHIKIIAYLCLGEPVWFPEIPMLETSGWKKRENIEQLVFWENWSETKKNHANTFDTINLNLQTSEASSISETRHSIIPPSEKHPSKKDSTKIEESNKLLLNNKFPHSTNQNANEFNRATFDIQFVKDRLDEFTKPKGSLGKMEDFVLQLASIQKRRFPKISSKTVLIVAADHGIAEEGISAFPSSSTYKMVYQYLAGGGAVSSFARGVDAKVYVADLGVDHDFQEGTALLGQKVRRGTRNFLKESALTLKEVEAALEIGKNLWAEIPETDVLSLGEVGIGNTTCTVVLTALLFDLNFDVLIQNDWIGIGTGVKGDLYQNKKSLIAESLDKYKKENGYYKDHIMELLLNVGGLEIIGMVGVILGSDGRGKAIVLDGLISTIAGVIATYINPSLKDVIFVGHLSFEKLHSEILQRMNWKPILDLGLRLGEATGSTLAMGILEQACHFHAEMKTWDEVNWF